MREIVPTVEQAGIDEGYLDLERGRAATSTTRARSPRRCRPSCARGRGSPARSASRRSKVVAKIASDRRKPGGLTVVRPGREAAFLAPLPDPPAARASARAPRSGCRGVGIETIGAFAAVDDDELRSIAPGKVGRHAARPGPRRRPARARGLDRADLDLDRGDLRARHRRPGAPARRAASDGATASPRTSRARQQTARTVTTKLRYPDFAIRTRSTSLPVGTDGRRADRRARLRPARPRAPRPARAAAPRRRRRLRARGARTTFSRLIRHRSVEGCRPDCPSDNRTSVRRGMDVSAQDRRSSHHHTAATTHVLRQRAGVPYEVERVTCETCRRLLGERAVRRAAA